MFVWYFSSHSRICQSFRYETITDERLQILTFALLPLSIDVSLACHIYWDKGHPFIMVSEDPWYPQVLSIFDSTLSLPVFTNEVYRNWDSNTQPSNRGTNPLTDCATVWMYLIPMFVVDIISGSLYPCIIPSYHTILKLGKPEPWSILCICIRNATIIQTMNNC